MQNLRYCISAIILILTSSIASVALALRDEPPPFSISPSLNGLNVNYFTHQDRAKLALFVVNHEKSAITCDAEYTSGPEKQNKRDEIILPEKAIEFKFIYGRHGTNVFVSLVCVKSEPQPSAANNTPEKIQ